MSGARTLQRGLEVLITVRDAGRDLSLTDIARATGLDRAVIARLLPPLVDTGFILVSGSPPRYVIGEALATSASETDDQEGQLPQDLAEFLADISTDESSGSWNGFDQDGAKWTEDDATPAQGAPEPGPTEAGIDDAYFAFLSFVGGMPLSHVARSVLGDRIPSGFARLMRDVGLDRLMSDYVTRIERMQELDPVAAFRIFYAGLSEREQDILRGRFAAETETLEAIAERHGLTRERVRQIVKGIRSSFDELLGSNDLIRRRTALARTSIGGIVDMRDLRGALLDALPMVTHLAPELDEAFFFLLEPEGAFARCGEKSSWFVDEETRRRLVDARTHAVDTGMSSAEFRIAIPSLSRLKDPHGFLAAVGLQELYGEVVPRNLSMNDRTVRLLRRIGSPISFDDIAEVLRVGERQRGLRNAILADERIVRVDRDTFALSDWGLTPYSTLRDLMRRELESAGGEARIADIKERLTARFDVKASSIDAYAKGPEFVRVAPGVIRLRADEESIEEVERPLHSLRGCVRNGRRWALRVEVTASLLRGFSVLLPSGMAPHFGVAQGESETLPTDPAGGISLVRKGLQDNIGRLRWVAEELGAGEGDLLFVRLPERQGGRITFSTVTRSELERSSRRRQAGLLLGLDQDLSLELACSALGLVRRSRPEDVVDRLRSRGEDDLADLVEEVLGGGPTPEVNASDIARVLGI